MNAPLAGRHLPAVDRGIPQCAPHRIDGHASAVAMAGGLGNVFDVMIEGPPIAELIQLGSLVRAPSSMRRRRPDLGRRARPDAGDYVEDQLAERMDRPAARRRYRFDTGCRPGRASHPGVLRDLSVAHSVHIRDEFIISPGEHFLRAHRWRERPPRSATGSSLKLEGRHRRDLSGNCMVLTEGWDCPEIGLRDPCRPTKQMGLYRQMVGRVLRPAPGKASTHSCLDHAGADLSARLRRGARDVDPRSRSPVE